MKRVIIVAALVGWIAGATSGLLAGIAIVVTAQTRAIVGMVFAEEPQTSAQKVTTITSVTCPKDGPAVCHDNVLGSTGIWVSSPASP
jgi:hypothetical protein